MCELETVFPAHAVVPHVKLWIAHFLFLCLMVRLSIYMPNSSLLHMKGVYNNAYEPRVQVPCSGNYF